VVNGVVQPTPWVAHPDNVSSFFNTGKTADATVSFSGGTEHSAARISLSGENVDGIIPNEYLRRLGGVASGTLTAGSHLTLNGSLNYVRNDGLNRPGQGYGNGIMEAMFVWFGRQVDMNALKANWTKSATLNNGPANREYNWNYSYHNNPYWMMYANPESDTRDRVIANASAEYQFTDWLKAQLRSGTDTYRYNIFNAYAEGNIELNNGSRTVDPAYNGAFANVADNFTENNTDFLVTANHDFTSHLTFNASVGGNRRYSSFQDQEVDVHGITVPNVYNVANAGLPPVNSNSITNVQVNSVYGDASATFNGWWTVEATGRNDWSSTLPASNNSYFYPSVNTSVILTDAIPALRNNWLSYLKLRGGTARVGNDAPAYQLYTPFLGSANKYNGLPLYTLSNTQGNRNLKPETTISNEGGIELGFLDNRLSLDGSIYDKYTTDEIT
jgi:outer membrane receptor protein involved in Fe transport